MLNTLIIKYLFFPFLKVKLLKGHFFKIKAFVVYLQYLLYHQSRKSLIWALILVLSQRREFSVKYSTSQRPMGMVEPTHKCCDVLGMYCNDDVEIIQKKCEIFDTSFEIPVLPVRIIFWIKQINKYESCIILSVNSKKLK